MSRQSLHHPKRPCHRRAHTLSPNSMEGPPDGAPGPRYVEPEGLVIDGVFEDDQRAARPERVWRP